MASHWLNKGMSQTPISYSEDQAQAYDTISEILRSAGVDLANGIVTPPREGKDNIAAVIGKAGSGKTLLLAQLYHALKDAFVREGAAGPGRVLTEFGKGDIVPIGIVGIVEQR